MSEDLEVFGKYELTRKLARGGMADVYLALERGFGGFERQLVVKRIREEITSEQDFVTMFTDEARLVSKLAHPNIANVYDFGEVDGVYYLTMEYVEGLTVAQIANRRRVGIPIEITLRIVGDVCSGLHYAHELCDDEGNHLGVVHRDVSPQNVMISKTGVAKLIDFGVARAATQVHITAVDQLKGKLCYIAPEMFVPMQHRVVDRRADIFAAGILLFEMYTGRRLFKRETEAETLLAVRDDIAPSVVPLGAPDEMDAIILRATAKNPDDRFATAQEMQDAIEELIVSLISQGSKLATPHLIARFVEEHLQMETAAGDNDSSTGSDPDTGDTMPGQAPDFDLADLPAMPGGTPVPVDVDVQQWEVSESPPDAEPPPPHAMPSMPPVPTPPLAPPAQVTDDFSLPKTSRRGRARHPILLLIAIFLGCIAVSIAVGYAAGSLVVWTDQPVTDDRQPAASNDSAPAASNEGTSERR